MTIPKAGHARDFRTIPAAWPAALSTLNRLFPEVDFDIDVRGEWGSRHSGHRFQIRSAAQAWTRFSISHCVRAGGFVALTRSQSHSIGFDIEEAGRLRPEIIRRITHPEDELPSPPHEVLVWPAKEAAFKALRGPMQPGLMTEIAVRNWIFDGTVSRFEFTGDKATEMVLGAGVAWREEDLVFSVGVVKTAAPAAECRARD